jgi:hypothetical protein
VQAAEPAVDWVVKPGDLVLFDFSFVYGPQGCADAFPSVDVRAWYEDVAGRLVPGSEFHPIVSYGRTSATGGFYVRADAADGYVLADTAVLYDCPDGSVLRTQARLYRWRVETQGAALPAGGAFGTVGALLTAGCALSYAQRRSRPASVI